MKECQKCGASTTTTKYIKENQIIDSSSGVKIDNEFIRSQESEYYFTLISRKEHLFMECIVCGYEFREATADAIKIIEQLKLLLSVK